MMATTKARQTPGRKFVFIDPAVSLLEAVELPMILSAMKNVLDALPFHGTISVR